MCHFNSLGDPEAAAINNADRERNLTLQHLLLLFIDLAQDWMRSFDCRPIGTVGDEARQQ